MSKLPYAGPGGLKVKDTVDVDVRIKVDAERLWNNTLEVFNSTSPWIHDIITDGYEGPNSSVEIWIDNPNWDDSMYTGEEELPDWVWIWRDWPEEYKKQSTIQRTFTISDMVTALETILSQGKYHCGSPVSADLDEWDSCCGDYMIQYMFFGELVYG